MDIYSQAKEIINKRRSKAINDAQANEYILSKKQDYVEIASKIGSLVVEVAYAEYKGQDTIKLKEELKIAEEQEEQVLKRYNFKKEDLRPKYVCPICEDKGYTKDKWCKCFQAVVSELIGYDNKTTFKDCSDINEQYKEKLQRIVESYPNIKISNILISGTVGAGKTCLTQAMNSEFKAKGVYTIFTGAVQLNKSFLEYHKCFNEDKENILDCFKTAEVLFIDDLGTEVMLNNVTKEYLLMLISERIALKKLTIITSNLSNAQLLQRYGERLFSRLLDKSNSIAINIQNKDLRLINRGN